MKNSEKGFCVFYDWVDDLDHLDGKDAWKILKALSAYHQHGTDPLTDLSGPLRSVCSIMLHQIKRHEAKAVAGRKGAEVTNRQKRINKRVQSADGTPTASRQHTAATETETITETFNSPLSGELKRAPPSTCTPACEKKGYGRFGNVMLLEEEHAELCATLGETAATELIERFSAKLKAKGYPYEDHYAALITWAKEDGVKPSRGSNTSFDAGEFFRKAIRRSQERAKESEVTKHETA